MSKQYVLAIDQGTTSSRAILFNASMEPVATGQQEFTQIFPQSGWVEHDPDEIWSTTAGVCRQAIEKAGIEGNEIAAIGITNQRETVVVWERSSGRPVYNAIVWQDRRTARLCSDLKARGLESTFREKTGLLLDPYFSGTKLAWILDQDQARRQAAEKGDLLFGTIDSYLIWRLTGGQVHATDATNASRTLLMNIAATQWDDELLALFDIPRSMLPEVRDNVASFGCTAKSLLGVELPICAMIGDQQAALVGQACFDKGMIKSTYGTGCFMLMNLGVKPVASQQRLVTTIAYQLNGQTTYALEGSIFVAGAAIQWLRDGLQIIDEAPEINALAMEVPDSGGVMLVPAFTGWGTPHWDPQARGLVIGLTRNSSKAHIARAALEGIALSVASLVELAEAALGHGLGELAVDGGAAASDPLLQAQSDCTGLTVRRPSNLESTARGVAILAGLQAGVIPDLDALDQQRRNGAQLFQPHINQAQRQSMRGRWSDAVTRSLNWHE